MIRRLWRRLCPRCFTDVAPVEQHPALLLMQRTEHRLDRMLELLARYELDPRPSGNRPRDMLAGSPGEEVTE